MDSFEDPLRLVSEVIHENLDALRVDIVGAGDVVLLPQVRHPIRQALPVQVLFRVVRLVLDQVKRGEDGVKAALLQAARVVSHLEIRLVQTNVVMRVGHGLRRLVELLQSCLVERLLHFFDILTKVFSLFYFQRRIYKQFMLKNQLIINPSHY